MTNIKPLHNRVLVKRAKAQVTQGGIILPESAQEKPKEGEIVAMGPGARKENGVIEPMHVKVGDRVLFSSYAGTAVESEEGEYMIMSEEDILCVLV